MKSLVSAALAGASVLALTSVAHAQSAPAAPAAAAPDVATLGEIVVTARRRAESLQEVPQVVNAVTTETLQKLNITTFQDIQNVVPGMSLSSNNGGYSSNASLRGVTFDVLSGQASPTVALYFNDAPAQAQFLFSSMFDVGQVEVLRGPQGTTRGESAPSGAITVTTRKPDLSDFGGYISALTTDLQSHNAQGALNIPIVKDVLAVRLAAVIDDNHANFVRSIHSSVVPQQKTTAERITVSFEPSDKFNATVMYQHMDYLLRQFQQEVGPGPGPGPFVNNSAVNPALTPSDRAAVDDAPVNNHEHFENITAQIDSRIFGQHLSYVGSYFRFHYLVTEPQDSGNSLPNFAANQYVLNTWEQTSHEIRLSSDPAPGRFFDYTVGAFYTWAADRSDFNSFGAVGVGAFGPPGTYNPAAANPNYILRATVPIYTFTQETSLFGSVTLHLDANTELTGGIRHIWSVGGLDVPVSLSGTRSIALPSSILGGHCSAVPIFVNSLYPGFCDFVLPAGPSGNEAFHNSATPNIYTVSLSHHFTRNLLAYANTGTAFRPAYPTVGLQGSINTDPAAAALSNHPAETSRAYEVGFKSTWFEDRVRLNAALFRQRFHNFGLTTPGINYLDTTTNAPHVSNNMSINVDALVQGFDIDTAVQITRDWNLSLQGSYADGKVEGSPVLCNITGPNGRPVFNYPAPPATSYVSLCNNGGSASHLPLWNATLQSEYTHPVTDTADGFIRGLWSYYPENKRMQEGLTVSSYSLVNLYAGVRSHDGAWELSIFAKNAFNNRTLLDKYDVPEAPIGQIVIVPSLAPGVPVNPNTGYFRSQFTPPREVGVSIRYAWGSR